MADTSAGSADLNEIVVTAQHLDEGRAHIQTQTGASTYTIDAAAMAATPGGDNTLLNQVIMQAPEVAQDSFGQFHIRGEHNGLQYRINGIILPEGISVFGQTLDPRLISSMSLITGALPAEYGLRTAGIIDITTKSGIQVPGGAVAIYGGSHEQIQPSFNYGGGSGQYSYFVTGDFLRNDLGIESPDGSSDPIHDHTTQYHGFGYFEDILDDENRVAPSSAVPWASSRFRTRTASSPHSDSPSTANDLSQPEPQRESARSHSVRRLELAAFGWRTRRSDLVHRPLLEPELRPGLGDLLFTGIAQNAYKQNVAYAMQSDGAYQLNDSHTLRAGLFLQTDHPISMTSSAGAADGQRRSSVERHTDHAHRQRHKTEWIESAYLQDEWKLVSDFTVNYGLRFDRFTAYTSDSQASPRVNMVWQALPDTTSMPAMRGTSRPRPSSWSAARISPCFRTRPTRRSPPKPRRRWPSRPTTTTWACSRRSLASLRWESIPTTSSRPI